MLLSRLERTRGESITRTGSSNPLATSPIPASTPIQESDIVYDEEYISKVVQKRPLKQSWRSNPKSPLSNYQKRTGSGRPVYRSKTVNARGQRNWGATIDLHLEGDQTITGTGDATKKATSEQLAALSALHQLNSLGVFDVRKRSKSSAQFASRQHDKSAEVTPACRTSANPDDKAVSGPAEQDDTTPTNLRSSTPVQPPVESLLRSTPSLVSVGSSHSGQYAHSQFESPSLDDSSASSSWTTVRTVASRRSSVSRGSIFTMRRHAREQAMVRQQHTQAVEEYLRWAPDDVSHLPVPIPRPARSPPPLLVEGQPKRKSSFLPNLFCCYLPIFGGPAAVKVDRAVQVGTDVCVVWGEAEPVSDVVWAGNVTSMFSSSPDRM
ncbi:hypothetical protein BC834DRAFT_901045 [Gloeopeniophorella convolvens]|nr:hypothetical protein BC834DRAFT_901045 [Gloeopeniophorella convolvens]